MPLKTEKRDRRSPLLVSLLIAIFAFTATAIIAPHFGWKPFGQAFDGLFEQYPKTFNATVVALLGYTIWQHWLSFRKTGDYSTLVWMFAYVAFAAVMVFILGALIALASNNALERTVSQSGPRLSATWSSWSAAQRDR